MTWKKKKKHIYKEFIRPAEREKETLISHAFCYLKRNQFSLRAAYMEIEYLKMFKLYLIKAVYRGLNNSRENKAMRAFR